MSLSQDGSLRQPSLAWRLGSVLTMGTVGLAARTFLLGASKLEVHGFENFQKILDARENVQGRQRGLLTGEPSQTAQL